MTKAIPAGFHSLTPSLIVANAKEAIEFYKKAFAAEVVGPMCLDDSGKVMHAEIKIGDSIVMLCDEFPEWGCKSPKTVGATSSGLYLYVENADTASETAIKAGATVLMPIADQFWGDRCAQLVDPYGHRWTVATHVEDLSEAEIDRRKVEFMKQGSCAK